MGVVGKFSLKGAKPGNKGGNYFKPGEYVVCIDEMKFVDVRNEAMPMFVLDCTVEDSTNDKVAKDDKRNWAQKLNTDWAASNIAELVMAAAGFDPHAEETHTAKDWDAELTAATSSNKFKGTKILVVCVSKLKKNMPDEPKNYRDICSFYPYAE